MAHTRPIDARSLRRKLSSTIENIKPDAPFATSGTLAENDLAFVIDGAGSFSTPLEAADVQRIIKSTCTQEGNLSQSTHGAWKVLATRINFQDQTWQTQRELVKRVCHELSIDPELVKADFIQMSIYGENEEPHFQPQKRNFWETTSREGSVFGTLCISLPSVHTGGDIVVSWEGQTQRLRTSPASAKSCSYLSYLTGDIKYASHNNPTRPAPRGFIFKVSQNHFCLHGDSI